MTGHNPCQISIKNNTQYNCEEISIYIIYCLLSVPAFINLMVYTSNTKYIEAKYDHLKPKWKVCVCHYYSSFPWFRVLCIPMGLISSRSQSGQQDPLPQPCTGVLWNSLGVCSSERSPPAPPRRHNLQHQWPPGSQSVWLQQERAAEKGKPRPAVEQGRLDWQQSSFLLFLLLFDQQSVTFLMPGFYGWMSDSAKKDSSFSDSQAEARTSSKVSGKYGERLYACVRSTTWFYSLHNVISLNQRFSNYGVRVEGKAKRLWWRTQEDSESGLQLIFSLKCVSCHHHSLFTLCVI